LRNRLYIGSQVWNRSKWDKDPDTGVRVRRERPESEWIIRDAPELRIIPHDLEARVARRLSAIAQGTDQACKALPGVGRQSGRAGPGSPYLLSGLLECGCCGSPLSMVNRERYGCSAHRHRGPSVCSFNATIPRERVERRILDAIRRDLYSPRAMALYRKEVAAEIKRITAAAKPDTAALAGKLADLDSRIANMVEMIAGGTRSPALSSALESAEAQRAALNEDLRRAGSASVMPLPVDLEGIFRAQIEHLERELASDVDAAREILREILGPVRVYKRDNAMVAELSGLYHGAVASFGSGGAIPKLAYLVISIDLS
jgi:hypothetical protein